MLPARRGPLSYHGKEALHAQGLIKSALLQKAQVNLINKRN